MLLRRAPGLRRHLRTVRHHDAMVSGILFQTQTQTQTFGRCRQAEAQLITGIERALEYVFFTDSGDGRKGADLFSLNTL